MIIFHLEEVSDVKPMHQHQYAFQKGKSTDDAISRAVTSLERGIMQNDYVIGVFLDIKGAFDNLSHEAQIQGMERHNVPPIVIKWHQSYLENRYASCSIGHQTVTAHLNTGTAQGDIGSPRWYNYNKDDLLEELSKGPAEEAGFADDLFFAVRGICKTTCRDKAQEAIDIAVEWATKSGLQFSPAKSQVLFITLKKKGNAIPPKPLTMYGKELEYVNEVTYLGVKIDKNLSWSPHIEHKSAFTCKNVRPKADIHAVIYIGVTTTTNIWMLCLGTTSRGERSLKS